MTENEYGLLVTLIAILLCVALYAYMVLTKR